MQFSRIFALVFTIVVTDIVSAKPRLFFQNFRLKSNLNHDAYVVSPRTEVKAELWPRTEAKAKLWPRTEAKAELWPRTEENAELWPRKEETADLWPRTEEKADLWPREELSREN